MAAPPIGNYFTEQHNGEQVVDYRGSRVSFSSYAIAVGRINEVNIVQL